MRRRPALHDPLPSSPLFSFSPPRRRRRPRRRLLKTRARPRNGRRRRALPGRNRQQLFYSFIFTPNVRRLLPERAVLGRPWATGAFSTISPVVVGGGKGVDTTLFTDTFSMGSGFFSSVSFRQTIRFSSRHDEKSRHHRRIVHFQNPICSKARKHDRHVKTTTIQRNSCRGSTGSASVSYRCRVRSSVSRKPYDFADIRRRSDVPFNRISEIHVRS